MPRDGSHVYSLPFPDVVEGTTIESAVYNGFTNDVAIDLNAPRPISSGGTGASSADEALVNLSAEKATQLVTNFNSHVWYPGSFRAAAGATGEPVAGHATAGWCYIGEALANPPTNQNVVVHAFDLDALAGTYLLYSRQKKAGVWSAWSITSTGDQQAAARQAIYAAPFDALAYNGLQVNGSMEVSQERGSSTSGTGLYPVDGWGHWGTGTQVTQAQQVGGVGGINVFSNALQMWVSTANASPLSTHIANFDHNIEGYRTVRLGWGSANASPITIGFWVNATRAGLFSGAVRNQLANRSYVFSYTINSMGTWEYKTVTIPGDVTGTWEKTNLIGIRLSFVVMSGSAQTTTPGAWTASAALAATGTTNCVATTADAFYITGVIVLPGIEAPSAERSALIMRPFDQELVTCQRYYEKTYPYGDQPGLAYGSFNGGGAIQSTHYATSSYPQLGTWYYKTRKRASPTTTVYSPSTGAPAKLYSSMLAADVNAALAVSNDSMVTYIVNNVSLANIGNIYGHIVANARL